ncbi:hypothetical protein PBY51_018315 [Eleginops maclovinus]|uniref:Uncharacterized protein n=1 Tax=Eleginops maclovinus TaxID=56733 RepID=A0AAN7YCY5_ELEMC|nr:hypothetical protein PBY51_018315 [Eleginops maclovinus]
MEDHVTQTELCSTDGGVGGKEESAVDPPPDGASCRDGAAATLGGCAVKVSTTVLHPVCLADPPLMLPLHLQGEAPYLITSQTPGSLPLVLDQLSSPQLPPLTYTLTPPADQKSQEMLTLLQDLLSQGGAGAFCPPPPYISPLAPLVPPPTLLVPYPVIIPLPVPLPVPLPIPVPPQEDSKGGLQRAVCSKSTQTSDSAPLPAATSSPPKDQALDLTVRGGAVFLKHEPLPGPEQDGLLDLSVGRRNLGGLQDSKLHWMGMDRSSGYSGSQGGAGSLPHPDLELLSSPQKVLVSVQDAALICGIRGLSGGGQQVYGGPSSPGGGQDPHRKKKSRVLKVRKVSPQEIHFLSVKKPKLLPRK